MTALLIYLALSFVFALLWVASGRGRSERTHALDEQARAETAERRERSTS